jgi:protein-S-isoprenylcysteine O-methyltransferase Ste14
MLSSLSVEGLERPLSRQKTRLERWSLPIIVGAAVFASLQLNKYIPLDPGVPPAWGTALIVAGMTLAYWASWTQRRARATSDGSHMATMLVTHGPYRLSRNPGTIGVLTALIGLALLFDNGWGLLLFATRAAWDGIVHIPREEAHLAALFGDAWTSYAARTRRWL